MNGIFPASCDLDASSCLLVTRFLHSKPTRPFPAQSKVLSLVTNLGQSFPARETKKKKTNKLSAGEQLAVRLNVRYRTQKRHLADAREIRDILKILLYNPDNGVTRNFMPHLWMFLLKSLTPTGHEVVLIDGNAQPMDEARIARYVVRKRLIWSASAP